MGITGLSLWQLMIIMLLSLSGDLKPNTEVLLGTPGTPRMSLDVQEDGWIDLSLKAGGTPPSNTATFKVENDTFIFPEGTETASPSMAFSRDASGNMRIKITDALAAAGNSVGGTLALKDYTPRLISITMRNRENGDTEEIRVTQKDGRIIVGTPDKVLIQMPVTISARAGAAKR
jgi:hypothetical protein